MAVAFPTTYLLIFNDVVYESTDSSGTSWVQELFPQGGPNGVTALATCVSTIVNGWILDRSATLWQRGDQNTFVRLVTGDLFPNSFDFCTFLTLTIPPSATMVGDIGQLPSPRFVRSTDGGLTVQTVSFPPGLFPTGSTFMRFWADPRTGANFLAQVRDPSGVDHLYASPDLQTWKPLALPTAPAVQAALLVAAALIGPVVAPTNWLPSQFDVGPQDNWLTAGAMYQEVINGSSLVIASQGSASITTTGGGNKQTTQFVCTKAIPGTDTAVTVFAVLFDSPGVTFAPGGGPSIVALGAGGADYTIPSPGTITQGGRSFLIAGQMANVFAPSPIPAGSVYQIQWTNNTPPGWTNATVLAMVLDVVGNYDILFGGLDNVSQGQDASPVTVDTGPTKPFFFTPPPPPYSMALQLMNVLTDGVPANLSVVGSDFTVPPGGPDPIGPLPPNILDFIRKQNGTFLVAVNRGPTGAPAIARSVDSGVTWGFATLGTPPNTTLPTPGLTECDDGTVLVPTDGSTGSGVVFRSTDDGQTFQQVQFPSPAVTAPVNAYLKYFPVINTLFAYVSQQAGGTGTSVQTVVYRSVDRGRSWGTQPVFTSTVSAPLPQQSTSWMALTGGSTFWGVDSVEYVTTPVDGYPTLLDAVVGVAGRTPAFWGRYIGPQSGNLKPDEITLLRTKKCRVLLIYRDTTIGPPFHVSTYQEGVNHATMAITDARGRGIPGGVWIYADIEYPSMSPTADFFRGWFDTMLGSIYGGGVYGNTSSGAAPQFNTPYCLAYSSDASMRAGNAPALVYANQPNRCDGDLCPLNKLANDPVLTVFSPDRPLPCNAPTVIYQYATRLKMGNRTNIVDFDLANGAGFASMWAP